MESCSSFGKQKGECFKPIFQILVYYYELFDIGILMVFIVNHILKQSNNEFLSKQWFDLNHM